MPSYEQGSVITTKIGVLCVQHDPISASFVVSGPATGVTWPTMTAWPLSVSGSVSVTDPGPVLAIFNYQMFQTPTGYSSMPEDEFTIPAWSITGEALGGADTGGAITGSGAEQVNTTRLHAISKEAARKAAYDYCNYHDLVVMRAEWTSQGPANKKLVQDALDSGSPK